MKDNKNTYMQNREISWMRFNERVLSEASQEDVAAYEKLKFISIFVSNLDEFFMVRVGSLHDLSLFKKQVRDSKTGMTPKEQINAILEMLPDMYIKKDMLYKNVMNELQKYNIKEYEYSALNGKYISYVDNYYRDFIKLFLKPVVIECGQPFPFIENGVLSVILELEKDGIRSIGLVQIRNNIQSFILLPGEAMDFILTEKIIYEHVDTLFPGYVIKSKAVIKITRNFYLNDVTSELADDFGDYKDKMKTIINKRKRQSVVRLESNQDLTDNLIDCLLNSLKLDKKAYFKSKSPLNMKYVFQLLDSMPSAKKEKILYPKFTSYYLNKNKDKNIMEMVKKKDLLLSYPYDDMQTFIDLLDEASVDENVTSIKITIYRLAKDSKIVDALCRAAGNGKDVTVVIELKARFDEENNIDYSNTLYQAGCNIIYGFDEYKIHSKLCLITYRNSSGEINYITQIGTGNYNENTAKLYADFCLITGRRDIGIDASEFFNNMAIGNLNGKYEHIVQSPTSLKPKFIKLIDREIEKKSDGYLFFKINSFTDKELILKLVEASKNGVKVKMVVRGICCLLPGVEGKTDNIEVRSIVGRFLEHARIYQFGKGDNADIYIGSADFMTRNTERRVEIACPVCDLDVKHIIQSYINVQLCDNIKGRKLKSNGEYELVVNNLKPFNSQEFFIEEAKKRQSKDLEIEENVSIQEKHLILEDKEKTIKVKEDNYNEKPEKEKGFFAKLFKL